MTRAVVRTSRAAKKVVSLDCCYSGAAMVGGMGASADLADEAWLDGEGTEGTYVMTATAATALALAEPGEPYTAFTGELIRVIGEGVGGVTE